MSLIRGLFVRKDATRGTTPVEARKALAGLLTPAGAFGARPGVLSGFTVTGTTGWAYSISGGHIATSRGASDGVILAANDGAATTVTDPAPGTGGRIDIVWVKHSDVDAGDATSSNDFGVARGVVSGSPVAPALPVGATELARATVLAGATSTSHANVTITNTAQRTGLRGGVIVVPTAAARLALGAPATSTAYYVHQVDTGALWVNAGDGWRAVAGDNEGFSAPTPATNFSAGTALVERRGEYVNLYGYMTATASFSLSNSAVTLGTLPFAPAAQIIQPIATAKGIAEIVINAAGGMTVRNWGAAMSFVNTNYLSLGGINFRIAGT